MLQPNLVRLPGPDDDLAREALDRAGPVIDADYLASLDPTTVSALSRYGVRCASLGLRGRDPEQLRRGVLALGAAAAARRQDPRDLMLGLALHVDAASRLGRAPDQLFADLADRIADPTTSSTVRAFVRRRDITLGVFGWRLVETVDGPDYELGGPP